MFKILLEFLQKLLNALVIYHRSSTIAKTMSNIIKMNSETDVNDDEQQQHQLLQLQQPKELSLFSCLNDAYLQSLVYLELVDDSNSLSRASTSSCGTSTTTHSSTTLDYESSSEEVAERLFAALNEQSIKEKLLKASETLAAQVQNVYVLYGNRAMLVVVRSGSDNEQVAQSIVGVLGAHGLWLVRRPMPYTTQLGRGGLGGNETMMVLVSEMSDKQLAVISADKGEAMKIIEAKTGLKLKKIKKSIYYAGILFQFILLNNLMSDRSREVTLASAMGEKKSSRKETGLKKSNKALKVNLKYSKIK